MTFRYGAGVATVILPIALGAAAVQRIIIGEHTVDRASCLTGSRFPTDAPRSANFGGRCSHGSQPASQDQP